MELLAAEGYRVVDAVRGGGLLLGEDGVVGLCFDDGYRDVAAHGLAVLERQGFRASVFVIHRRGRRRGHVSWYARQPPLLGWRTSARWTAARRSLRGAHAHAPEPARARREAARREIAGSKARSRRGWAARSAGFCYPGGLFGARERALVAAAGFRLATSCEPGANRAGSDPLALRRIQVDARDRLADFRAKLEGGFDRPGLARAAYRRLLRALRREQWPR